MPNDDSHPPDEPQVPGEQALADDLTALFGPPVTVPERVDEAILAMGRRRLGRPRRRVRLKRWAAVAAAAALAIALVLVARQALWPEPIAGVREDIDRNGRVNILDAFTLARHVVAEREVKAEWDLNEDGVVDAADVDTVAHAAVRLD